MESFPLFVRLENRPVLVVGGGEIALRKLTLLHAAGARLTCIAPELDPAITALTGVRCLQRPALLDDLVGVALLVCATDDQSLNRQFAAAADARGIWVNVVDDPAACSVTVPSIIDRSPLVIALGSGGAAPVLLRSLRRRLEAMIPQRYADLTTWLGRKRDEVKARVPDATERRRFWERVIDGPVARRLLAGDAPGAQTQFEAEIADTATAPQGEVWLVGAGPGDPDLLTLRALQLMQQADVVLHDRLLSPEIMDRVRRDADRIDVGKQRDRHTVPQNEITARMIALAREGKRVLRLKGGDPFVFGRGGEEMQGLVEAGIPFQIVPGISAANGCAAYAGIPLTHRDHAQSVRFVTGHLQNGAPNLDWPELARPGQTLVIYMGLGSLPQTVARLLEHGMAATTPVAVIENGTRDDQRVVTDTLAGIAAAVAEAGVEGPSLVIIGSVVSLRDALAWRDGTASS